MFKMVKRIIGIILIIAIIFIALALWRGGEPFKWFGKKSENAGKIIREKSKAVGEEADRIKEKKEHIKEVTEQVTKGVGKAGEKIKNIGSKDDEK